MLQQLKPKQIKKKKNFDSYFMLSSPCTIMLSNAFNLPVFKFFFYELSDDKRRGERNSGEKFSAHEHMFSSRDLFECLGRHPRRASINNCVTWESLHEMTLKLSAESRETKLDVVASITLLPSELSHVKGFNKLPFQFSMRK